MRGTGATNCWVCGRPLPAAIASTRTDKTMAPDGRSIYISAPYITCPCGQKHQVGVAPRVP